MKEKLLELIITYGLCMGDDEEGFSEIIAILDAQQAVIDAADTVAYGSVLDADRDMAALRNALEKLTTE